MVGRRRLFANQSCNKARNLLCCLVYLGTVERQARVRLSSGYPIYVGVCITVFARI